MKVFEVPRYYQIQTSIAPSQDVAQNKIITCLILGPFVANLDGKWL